MNQALLTSVRQTYNTPQEALEPVYRFSGVVSLDPCSNENSIVIARRHYVLPALDGLKLEWYSTTFVNPPYGREVEAWMLKARSEWINRDAESLTLIAARPDTRWFQLYALTAPALLFWRGRLTFLGAPAPAPFPSAIVYYGNRIARFKAIFGEYGKVVTP